jgi:hypothetical protein
MVSLCFCVLINISFLVRSIDSHYTFGLLVKKFKREESEIKRQLSGSSPRKSNWALYEDMKFASAASDDTSL